MLFRYNRDAWLNFTEHGTAEQYDPAPDLSAQSLTNVYYELCQSLLSDEKKKKKQSNMVKCETACNTTTVKTLET